MRLKTVDVPHRNHVWDFELRQKGMAIMEMRRRSAACLAVVLFCAAMPLSVQATEETKQQIREAEQQREETENRLDETEKNLQGLNEQHSSLQGTLSTLNTELTQVSNNLEIDDLEADIAQVEQELAEAIALKDEQYATMKKQIQFTYERSSNLYMELFFSSGSLSDFLNKNEYIEQLSAYQKKVLDEYKAAQAAMEQKQEELELAKAQQEQNREELADYRVQVVAEQGRVSGLVSQTSSSLNATENQISEAEAAALAYEQQLKEQEENLSALRAKLAEEIRMAELAAQSSWRDISEVSFAEGDRYLLANLIYCEAGGEPYVGQVAVGSVVINRVLSSVYPDTVTGVIYQSGQFSPVGSGRLALALAEGRATASCYQAADEVMGGTTNVSNCVYFRTPVDGIEPRYRIGGHIFY